MEERNFILLWKEYYEKIDQSLAINTQLLKETISSKAQLSLRSLIRFKSRGIIAFVIYLFMVGLLLFFAIFHYSSAANYFIISMGAIFLINLKGLYDYIKHLVWTHNIDYNGSVTEIQDKLIRLQLSIFSHARLMVLQFPFWTTFMLSNKWFPQDVAWGFVIFQFVLTGSFTWLAYWLYKNQTIENAGKKWVKNLIAASGGGRVSKALEMYKELERFKLSD